MNYEGTSGDDTYTGTPGNDVINGNDGNDILAGGDGADTIDGGNGSDALYSRFISPAWSQPYFGIAGVAPLLDTGTEVDTLRGGAGYDILYAGYGDNVDGGADGGALLISFQGGLTGVTFNIAQLVNGGTATIGGGVITNISAVPWVDGSNFADTITGGDTTTTVLHGFGGDDNLIAGGALTFLYGGDGNDILDMRASLSGGDVFGDDGNDTIYTNDRVSSSYYGGVGNDTFYGTGNIHGGAGNDVVVNGANGNPSTTAVFGGDGDDTLTGSNASDALIGNNGADTIDGGDGDDRLFSGGTETTDGGAWSTFVDFAYDTFARDNGTEIDHVSGGAGNDYVSIGYGDFADGGTGTNTLQLSFGGAGTGVTVSLAAIRAGGTTIGGGTIVNFQQIAAVDGSAFADSVNISGQTTRFVFNGGAGDDTLVSGSGDDDITGGAGADTIYAGDGVDSIRITAQSDIAPGEFIDGGASIDTVFLYNQTDWDVSAVTFVNVEKLDFGLDRNHTLSLTASQLNNFSTVLAYNIRLTTGGAVSMYHKYIYGDASVTLSDVGNSFDLTGYLGNGAGVTVIGGAGSDVVTTVDGNDNLRGGGGDDILNSGDGNDQLNGGTGRDEFHGGVGNDYIMVSDGDFVSGEIYDGGDGVDTLVFSSSTPIDISNSTLTGIEKLSAGIANFGAFTLRLDQLAGLSTIGDQFGSNAPFTLSTGGSISLTGKSVYVTTFNLAAANTSFDLTGQTLGFRVTGNNGNDVITGGDGNDQLTGGAGRDEIHGGAGIDRIFVTAADYMAGEIYDGGGGTDTLDLGAGIDISASTVSAIETLYLAGGTASLTGAQLQGFSSLQSNLNNETLTLTTGGSIVFAGSANTVTFNLATAATSLDLSGMTSAFSVRVNGNAGNDIITGSNFADTLYGGAGRDELHGGDGNDAIIVANGDYVAGEIYDGGAGSDTLAFQGVGSINLTSSTVTAIESLIFNPNVATSTLTMTGAQLLGFTSINAGGSSVTLTTGGSISLSGKSLSGTINLASADTVFDLTGASYSAGSFFVVGGSGNDTITGSGIADNLTGGAGNDRLDGRGGADTMTGGTGDDTYVLDNPGDRVFENANGGTDTIESSVTISALNAANVEILRLTGTANINANGTASVANTIYGNSGNNVIDGSGGGDRMEGGLGHDTYIVRSSADVIVEAVGAGTDSVVAAVDYVIAAGVEIEMLAANVTASTYAINLTGNDYTHLIQGNYGTNELTGGSGADSLYGYNGDDRLDGGAGADTMVGGLGDDLYLVDNIGDRVLESAGEGEDTIKAFIDFSLVGIANVETLRIAGTATQATGNASANVLVGNALDNVLDGGGGGDRMKGGYGNDTYIVRDATDIVTEISDSGTNDIVKAAVSYTLRADSWVETLMTVDSLATTAINLTGNGHSLVIQGNAGANVLTSGSSSETLTGGAGPDTFTFLSGNGQDHVGDFVSATDKLDLSAFFTSFAAFQAATSDVGGNAVIDLGGGNTVTLDGVLKAQVQSGDVIVSGGGGSVAPVVPTSDTGAAHGLDAIMVGHHGKAGNGLVMDYWGSASMPTAFALI